VLVPSHYRTATLRATVPLRNTPAQGIAVDVPIYLPEPAVDFRCCVVDRLYRRQLMLRNRGKTALLCLFVIV